MVIDYLMDYQPCQGTPYPYDTINTEVANPNPKHPSSTSARRKKFVKHRNPYEIHLTTETVESASLSLEGVDNIEGSNGLALCVLSVCDRIADDTFKEGLEDTSSFFVDH
jgi:hypothetical protein